MPPPAKLPADVRHRSPDVIVGPVEVEGVIRAKTPMPQPTATPSRPDRSHVPPKHTLNHNTKLGLACLAKLKPIFSKHAHKAKDQAVKTTAQQLHLPIHEPEHVQRMLRTRDVKLASLTTPNHEWVAIVDDMAKFMYPSLNLEGHDLATTDNVEAIVSTTRLQWQVQPQYQNPMDHKTGHERLGDQDHAKHAFDRKLQVAEKMLRLPLTTPPPPTHDMEESGSDSDDGGGRGSSSQQSTSKSSAPKALVPKTLTTRKKLKTLAKYTSEEAKTEKYANKVEMLAKWSKLQTSRGHETLEELAHRRALQTCRRRNHRKEVATAFPVCNELSPRSLYFEECTAANILPEPLLSRITPDRRLELSHFGLGDAKAIVLSKSLALMPDIHALNLTDNRLTHAGIATVVQQLSGRLELHSLNLSVNEIGEAGCASMADFIFSAPNLTHLDLSQTKLLDTFESLANEIAIHPHLLSVNLTNNEIGDVGGQLLGATLAAATCTIQDLNLSWNQICHAGATAIGHALQTNRSVQHLNLSMNRFGDDGGHQVAAALLVNTTLRTVDMTRNNLMGSTAVSLSYAIEHNPKAALYNLVLVDNPLGCTGTKALLRSVARGSRCSVRLSFYGGEDTNNAAVASVFDSSFPAAQSPYELHLHTSPYEYVIACQLVAAAVAQRCELFDVTFEPAAEGDYHEHHVRKNATTTKPANINVQQLEYCDQAHGLVEKGSTKQFDLRHRGILRISARYVPWRIQTTDDVTPDGLRNVIKIIKDRISTREMCAMLEVATTDLFLHLRDVELFVKGLLGTIDVVDIMARTLHCIVDGTQTLPFLLRHLSFSDQNRLMSSHGVQVLQFNPVNPTGKWTLDLSDRIHRKLAVWFSMINRDEATESMRRLAFRGNTSQRGTFANFRNEKLNGKAFELTDRFFDGLPNKGVLEFDYVSTRRPEDVDAGVPTSVLGEVQVNALLQTIGAELWSDYVPQHKRYDLKRQVVLLQHALSGQYIMAEHVRMLMQYFPKNIDNLRLKAVLAAHRSILDMENFEGVYEKLLPADRKAVLARRRHLDKQFWTRCSRPWGT
ncbi:hypothetical protein, variant [Aphanomyces invadans]|uniref:DUF4476 domain-containing protein n=1 Tax=Aphanomyces invadans TaxID=157072 RepID=A0A024TT16_9STRA|nr:hypothetical protein, variant [Aphanomyces invadans]ETV96776.1 hypothetical protein, variant [Aphanomyces invadans]|eukprot:XP_008874552.1 hypothetical protein, variant [Aphanomyces invadans]